MCVCVGVGVGMRVHVRMRMRVRLRVRVCVVSFFVSLFLKVFLCVYINTTPPQHTHTRTHTTPGQQHVKKIKKEAEEGLMVLKLGGDSNLLARFRAARPLISLVLVV